MLCSALDWTPGGAQSSQLRCHRLLLQLPFTLQLHHPLVSGPHARCPTLLALFGHIPCRIHSTSSLLMKLHRALAMARRRAPACADLPPPDTVQVTSCFPSRSRKWNGNISCSLEQRQQMWLTDPWVQFSREVDRAGPAAQSTRSPSRANCQSAAPVLR